MGIRLNLGSGNSSNGGYSNVDIHPFPNVQVVHDIEQPLPFADNSVEHIFTSHSLEHCSMDAVPKMLKDWFRVLGPKGTIKIIVPELEACLKNFLNASEEERWGYRIEYIFGGQDNQVGQQLHKSGFTVARLRKLVENAGFRIESLTIIPNACNDCIHLIGTKIKNI